MTNPIAKWLNAARAWHVRRVTTHQLAALDDRLLRDIGIARADLDAVAHGLMKPGRLSSAPAVGSTAPAAASAANDNIDRLAA